MRPHTLCHGWFWAFLVALRRSDPHVLHHLVLLLLLLLLLILLVLAIAVVLLLARTCTLRARRGKFLRLFRQMRPVAWVFFLLGRRRFLARLSLGKQSVLNAFFRRCATLLFTLAVSIRVVDLLEVTISTYHLVWTFWGQFRRRGYRWFFGRGPCRVGPSCLSHHYVGRERAILGVQLPFNSLYVSLTFLLLALLELTLVLQLEIVCIKLAGIDLSLFLFLLESLLEEFFRTFDLSFHFLLFFLLPLLLEFRCFSRQFLLLLLQYLVNSILKRSPCAWEELIVFISIGQLQSLICSNLFLLPFPF